MSDREKLILNFLKENNLENAKRIKLSSDASFRRYERIVTDEQTIMLMDAPPEKEDVGSFVKIDKLLTNNGFSAPEIYAEDQENGFLLLEDMGSDSFTNVLSGKSKISSLYNEYDLYMLAIDALIQLREIEIPGNLNKYSKNLFLEEVRLFVDWFLPYIEHKNNYEEAKEEYIQIWNNLLNINMLSEGVVLRDYHADNLMWLPARNSVQKVGLLDFQDAVIGSPVYDIVSLLEDARRDVGESTVQAAINRYLDACQINKKEFMSAYYILAAQRNCKIIGIFARLTIRDKKKRYIDYMPRVWNHLLNDLQHPDLNELKIWIEKYVPENLRKKEAFKIDDVEFAG